MKRAIGVLVLVVMALALVAGPVDAGRRSPEVDWFVYSMSGHSFQWQTFEEVMARGFSVEYAPDRMQGLAWEPPVSLWSSGYIFAQHPGTLGGGQYEVAAPRAARMHRPVLCTWYQTWWICDLPSTTVK